MLKLKEICLRRIAAILYVQPDILISQDEFDFQVFLVEEKMSKLKLPPLITKQMKSLVRPIGSEIRNWIFFLSKYFHTSYGSVCDMRILEQLCWTILGTVDYRKTAERLIHLDMLDFVERYRLACLYCLDEYISVLWFLVPEENKKYFYKEEGPLEKLEFFWPYILKGEGIKLDNFNQYAFEYSASKGNKAATEYFFRKLTYNEREYSLLKTTQALLMQRRNNSGFFYISKDDDDDFPKETLSDTFCYLLSLMSPEQQMEIFKRQPYDVLLHLLDWPWQDIFLDIAELISNFLTADNYFYLLRNISMKIKSGYCLTKVFQNFFLRSPSDFRKHFVDKECQFDFFFRDFFELQDTESIKVIFRNVDPGDRKRLVFSKSAFKFFYDSILSGKCNLVELCLQEATLSKEDKDRLKEVFHEFVTQMEKSLLRMRGTEIDTENINSRENIWKQFFTFLD
ncbi:hypothetical protein AVEN_115942-1 [Araneus ventricosus]|uniref:Uncharacterized protein n=1 Tax=Araneus ventricosus TaxID=182803 RepID=A0A4Y2M9A2_ARAVE|nr:hypothetical protein AVEN_115942-1 [Araneus ventricosus]